MILVSACLAGINCKYNGGNNLNSKILEMVKKGEAIPVCPEQLGGMSTPRIPSEIKATGTNRYVVNQQGKDVTEYFQRGAQEVLKLAQKLEIHQAILQARSPSCGRGNIYNGCFDKHLIDGNGVTAQLLIDNGIEVISSEEISEESI